MMAKTTPLAGSDGAYQGEIVECPACGYGHFFRTVAHKDYPVWTFNGDRDNPTFSPSMLVNSRTHVTNPNAILCHSFVREGRIEFLSDCSHGHGGPDRRASGDRMSKLYGIDVSHHQAPASVPWSVIGQTSHFCIVRSSYGTMRDRVTLEHVKRARAVKLKVGLYHFFRPTQPVQAQLDVFLAQLEAAKIGGGDIVPTLDVEHDPYPKPGVNVSPAWQDGVRTILAALRERFGGAMVYITQREFGMLGAPEWLLSFPLWVAHYTGAAKPATPGNRPWTIWQHRVAPYVPFGAGGYDKANPVLDQNLAVDLPLIATIPSASAPAPAGTDESDDGLEDALAAEYIRVTEERPGAGRALLEYEQAGLVDDPTEPRS